MAALIAQVLGQLPSCTSDAVLLERYIHQHDEAAFAALVARHGAMVLRLCRRVLNDAHAAEDAFQATFLILARKASSLKQPDALPAWLYGVARRVALKARGLSSGRATAPLDEAVPDPHPDPLTQLTAREVLDILDEEVQRLPAGQRSVFVLCCLEGHTQEEAARLLGCTTGSIKGRLERGRRRLHARLQRRGIALPAALALVVMARDRISARVPALLLQNTIRAALGGGIGSSAAALAHSVLKMMLLGKLAGVMTVVLTVALAASATVALVYHAPVTETPEDKKPAVPAAPKDAGAGKPQARTDALGDPLPEGAIARLGTVRFRHGGVITFAAFTPDDKRLVSQGSDGVRVWDVATGKQVRHFAPALEMDWGATDLSPNGKSLAAAIKSSDGKIDFWDISTGRKNRSLGQGYYALVRFSPDGKRLAAYSSASAERAVVELWDAASQRKLRAWKAHGSHQVMRLAFSADSRELLTSGLDGKVRLWDTETGRQLQEFTRINWKLGDSSLSPFGQNEALSPDGKLVALLESNEESTSKTGAIEYKTRISLRDAATGKQLRQLTCPTQKDPAGPAPTFTAMTFTGDSKKLLTGGPDRFLRVWDSITGEELRRWPLELACPYSLTLSNDGKTLAAVMDQGKGLELLDMATGKPRTSRAGHLAQVGLSALAIDGRTAITDAADRSIFLWDVAKGQIRHRLNVHKDGISSMQLAPDGRTLYTVGQDQIVRIWDLADGEERRRFPLDQDFQPAWLGALALSPDGGTLAVLSVAEAIYLFDTASGRELRRFKGAKWILGSAFTPDGRSLVAWSGDLKVRIWDTTKGRLLHEYPLPPQLRIGQPIDPTGRPSPTFYHAALSPDGRLLAIGNNRHALPLEKCFLVFKDLATGRDIRRLDHLPADVHRLAFSPDGRVLAWSSCKDWSIHLMETASGRERRCLSEHRGPVLSLAFSADGERLISGSMDTTALVWDLGRQIDPRRAPAALTEVELNGLWADLAAEEAVSAYRAICKLAAAPKAAIPFLRERLRPIPSVEAKRITRWIAELDSDDFATRQNAMAELENLGEQAVPTYRKALDSKPSPEARRRLEDLLDKAQRAWRDVSGERLRSLRAIEALELAGTKEAYDVLRTLAAGAAGARLTEQAKAARERLERAAKTEPRP